jgi:hypothetical protein
MSPKVKAMARLVTMELITANKGIMLIMIKIGITIVRFLFS